MFSDPNNKLNKKSFYLKKKLEKIPKNLKNKKFFNNLL